MPVDYMDDVYEEPKRGPRDYEKKTEGRIVRTVMPNKDVRTFTTRHSFISGAETIKWSRGIGWTDILGKSTDQSIDPFLEKVTEIDGVTEVSCYGHVFGSGNGGYGISVYVAESFDWDTEIEPLIFVALMERDEMMKAQFGK